MIQMELQGKSTEGDRQDAARSSVDALETLLAGVEHYRSALFGADSSAMLLADSLTVSASAPKRLAAVVEVGTPEPELAAWMFNQRPGVVRISHCKELTPESPAEIDARIAEAGNVPLLLLVAPRQPSSSVSRLLQRLFTVQMSESGRESQDETRLLALRKAFTDRIQRQGVGARPQVVAARWDASLHRLEILEG